MKRVIFAILLALGFAPSAIAETNLALVLGSKDYEFLAALDRSGNDVKDVSEFLQTRGYNVTENANILKKKDLEDAVANFSKSIKIARNSGAVRVILYYTGHGTEAYGTNYLITPAFDPKTDPRIKGEKLFSAYAVKLKDLIKRINEAGASEIVVILDACRSTAIETESGMVSPSFDQRSGDNDIGDANGSILYSSSEKTSSYSSYTGETSNRNSVFTHFLLQLGTDTDRSIATLNDLLQGAVSSATSDRKPKQFPMISDRIPGETFLFKGEIAIDRPKDLTPSVKIFFADSRLGVAQQLAAELNRNGFFYGSSSDDFVDIKNKLKPGSDRITYQRDISAKDRVRMAEVAKYLLAITGKQPILTPVAPENLIAKPFQIQLF